MCTYIIATDQFYSPFAKFQSISDLFVVPVPSSDITTLEWLNYYAIVSIRM